MSVVEARAGSNGRRRAPNTKAAKPGRRSATADTSGPQPTQPELEQLRDALLAVTAGDFGVRLPRRAEGIAGELFEAFNELATANGQMSREISRVGKVVGRDGLIYERASLPGTEGAWQDSVESINGLIDHLVRPTTEFARVIDAVAKGDLSQKMAVRIEGRPVKGEFLKIRTTVNAMVDRLSSFADEVSRVSREVGTEGKLGGQAKVKGVSGVWKDLTDNVNYMASNLTDQVRNIAEVTTAVANGDLSRKITVDVRGELLQLKDTINTMVDQLRSFADEVTRVARDVGTEGRLGGQANVPGVSGVWKDLTDNVNFMASNLTDQVRNIAEVTTAVAYGDLSRKITVDVRGELAQLKDTINTMVDQLSSFADEVTRVAREVGTEGKLGGQAEVKGVSGTWKDLTDNVNFMASNLTDQVRNIAQVATAVADGDLSQEITVDAKGEVLQLKNTINTMVDQLSSFADEVTRVAREVGTEGKLGGQAQVKGVSGTWGDLTNNVNFMASNLTDQVRNIAQVATAVANGDLSQKITVDAKGEVLQLKNTINTMVDQLSSFADEVTRVAREVGTEGKLGGQANVQGVSGTWKDLTDNVNTLAGNLTSQVRNIAEVTTAVANGDLSQKITVDVKGEVLRLKRTVNTMVDQLSSFADEVTRVAREVGTDGKLGGQAQVRGVSGTWKDLTDNVNTMASSLTAQVRAIADVSTAVTQGDLTRSIAVGAQGEVAELKDTINQMIVNLRETTERNADQGWLNSNLARFGGMMQGQRDLGTVTNLVMSELTPLVSAHSGSFFLTASDEGAMRLLLAAGYGSVDGTGPRTFAAGEGLVGQAAATKQPILLDNAPAGYIKVRSSTGEASVSHVIVLPVLFEDQVLGVIELASFAPFSAIQQTFLEQLVETIGIVINAIIANMRTEELLEQSQSLTQELQKQQQELQQTNAELGEKAALLAQQNERIEVKNREIEMARLAVEEKAEQLALSSRYKSEFLANMSHELRTPLNSLLILAKLLSDNDERNLDHRQVEFARTIFSAGNELLELINDILDLSKVEAGKMDVQASRVALEDVVSYCDRAFRPLVEEKDLSFTIELADDVPTTITTDEQRLLQILRNLLSNAIKFTTSGGVTLRVQRAGPGIAYTDEALRDSDSVIAFQVADSGIGIARDRLHLIFEAFQQADGTTSRRFGGTGLGLSISREIARLLGSEIHVESQVGEGSTFTLYVPRINLFEPSLVSPAEANATALVDMTDPMVEPVLALPVVPDDRETLTPDDHVLLIIEDDPNFARTLVHVGRSGGFKCVVALRGDTGVALAHECSPDAILLDLRLPVLDGWRVLSRVKTHPSTCDIPVYAVSGAEDGEGAVAAGAVRFLAKPIDVEALRTELDTVGARSPSAVPSVLLVEERGILTGELAGTNVDAITVATPDDALDQLANGQFDGLVVDLELAQGSAFHLIETVTSHAGFADLPVIAYASRELTDGERIRLGHPSIRVRSADAPANLLDDLVEFLAGVKTRPTSPRRPRQRMLPDHVFRDHTALIVDDDVRNVFALTSVLEARGMDVVYAENGTEGVRRLLETPDVDIVLMDVMMPEMDGYQTIDAIRKMPEFASIPIIAVTAKAMKADRERAIASGASSYITKPVDVDELLSLMGVWLYPLDTALHHPQGV